MTGKGVRHEIGAPQGKRPGALPEIAGYEILERIGRGGMGEVYSARQLNLGRLVAIKFLVPEGESDGDDDLARFRHEANLMARVSHPNILSIFDFGEIEGRPYLVMEYVEGGDLRRRMTPGVPMSPSAVRETIAPVGAALEYLHRHGIIHRDLKPENILLHDGKNPRVSDFGIAVLRTGSGPNSSMRTGRGPGTVGYVAPEQQYRLKVDERADQYSLAALSYEMLTGRLPLGIFEPPSALNPALSPCVDEIVLKALNEEPKQRFNTMGEFTESLCHCLESCQPVPPARRLDRRLAWAVGLLCVALAAVVAFRSLPGGNLVATEPAVNAPGPPASPGVPVREPSRPGATERNSAYTPPAAAAPRVGPDPKKMANLEEKLKALRARRIWVERGRPAGKEGEAQKDDIWFAAVKSVQEELEKLAYNVWQEYGSPTGAEGEARKEEFWHEAQKRLQRRLREEVARDKEDESRAALRKMP